MSDKASERTIPAVNASGALDGDALADHISAVVEQGAAAFLAGRRWFGDKARRIERAETFDVAVVSAGPDYFAPTLVTVGFADGGSAAYFLPLVITLESLPEDATLGTVVHGEDHWRLVEGLSVPRFQEWLLSRLEAPATLPMQAGTLQFEPTSVLSRYLAVAQTGGSRAITGEQSNTSIIYGDAAILKAFRKIQPGVNPDIEIGAYLTEETEFRHVPPVL
ncbi:MAG: maltokinase N-terminal cap-like domain-containing protein, partial [Thermomicrobiales bacterium]